MPPIVPGPESMWRLEIGPRGERFKGVLLLKKDLDNLEMVILDPSGITLAGALVDISGRVMVNDGLPRVRNTGLASFVGRSLARIFYLRGTDNGAGCRRGDGWLRYFEVCVTPEAINLDNPWPEPDLKLVLIR